MKYKEYDDETLKKLQNLELMVLKDFIKICDENDIKYYIYGGSLLGAIRHKGFIPWDDDVDVIMFNEDYEKFKKIFLANHDEKYEFLNYEASEDYFFSFSKIMLKGTKFEEWWSDQVDFTVGINIDIFILYDVPDNNLKRFIHTKICRFLERVLTLSSIKLENYPFFVQTISNTTHSILNLLNITPHKIFKHHFKLLNKYDNTKRVCDICALNHPQIYLKNDYGDGIKVEFEDIQVNIPINYSKILEQIYGDYMELPPKEKRYNHFPHNLDFGPY